MTIHLFGIPNCDTVKKARLWLAAHEFAFVFHDFKKEGVDPVVATAWLGAADWQILINRKGTTWRALPDARRALVIDASSALALMCEYPSVIKRPVLHSAGQLGVGFSDAQYRQFFHLDEAA